MTDLLYKDLSEKIISASIEVHRNLDPGLLESSYEACLVYELNKAGLKVKQQVPLPVVYKEIKLNSGYRLDLVVEDKIIVE